MWRPWEGDDEVESNVNAYAPSTSRKTAKAVGLSRQAVSRVVERGPTTPKKCKSKKQKFEKADNFTCDLIRRTVYDFLKKMNSRQQSVIVERIPNLTGEQSDGITVFRIPPMTSLMLHRCRTGTINLQR
ncbi:hypothetical protein ANN_26578 [Periplaneta americana]|uniref:Uncharacterized protein n=1 Tax=Periplaneta americana TaxID=6978 RepID=A0ABQ8RYI3_PERAM|nr:hypothetical protein ANN_26578 [Periplaneta americana]